MARKKAAPVRGDGAALLRGGTRQVRKLDYAGALKTFQRALSSALKASRQDWELSARCSVADVCNVLGRWNQAEAEARAVLESGQPVPCVRAWLLLGEVIGNRGDPEEAAHCFQEALELAQKHELAYFSALAAMRLSAVAGRTGAVDRSRQFALDTLAAMPAHSDKQELRELKAGLHVQLGLCSLRRSQLPLAEGEFWSAIDALQGRPSLEEAHVRRYLGVLAGLRGRHRTALLHHMEAFRLFEKAGCRFGLAKTYESIGRTFLVLNRMEEAVYTLKKSAAMCRRLGADSEMATIYGKLGQVYLLREEYERAADYFRRDLATSSRFRNDYALGFSYRNLGRCQLALGALDQAVESLRRSLQLFDSVQDAVNVGRVQMDLCQAYTRQGKAELALAACQAARKLLSDYAMDRELAYLGALDGVICRLRGDYAGGERRLKAAIAALGSSKSSAWLAEAWFELGLLYLGRNRAGALDALQNALRTAREAGLQREKGRFLAELESHDPYAFFNTLMEGIVDSRR
ncbi:MAG: tetratricopeptide repeat protein [Candidatus Eremiobacterota bacterium]